MSFGYSCLNTISAIIDICDRIHDAVSNMFREKLSQQLSELAIIARACERVTTPLEYAHFCLLCVRPNYLLSVFTSSLKMRFRRSRLSSLWRHWIGGLENHGGPITVYLTHAAVHHYHQTSDTRPAD